MIHLVGLICVVLVFKYILNHFIICHFSSDSLDNTTAWLQAAASEVVSACEAQSDSPGPDSCGPLSPTAVLNRAYIRLLHWDPQDQKYPEVSCRLKNYITPMPFIGPGDILLIMRECSVCLPIPPHWLKACELILDAALI